MVGIVLCLPSTLQHGKTVPGFATPHRMHGISQVLHQGIRGLSLFSRLHVSQISHGAFASFGSVAAPSFSIPPELENHTIVHRGDVRWGDMVRLFIA